MGSGRTGARLAAMLDSAKNEVTVVDFSGSAFARLPDDFGGRTVIGNGVDQDVLRRAGIESADAFVAATSGDNRNIMAAEIARDLFHVPKVIARIKDPNRAQFYSRQGIEVDCRTMAGARILLDLVDE